MWTSVGGGGALGLSLDDAVNKETFGETAGTPYPCDTNCNLNSIKFRVIKSGSDFILQGARLFEVGTWSNFTNACIAPINTSNLCTGNGSITWSNFIINIVGVSFSTSYTSPWRP